jgi:hypothetical protein
MASLTTRVLPMNGANGGAITGWAGPGDIGGISARRFYSAGGAGPLFLDVPGPPADGDASVLGSFGFVIAGASGPTSVRPTAPGAGWLKPGLIFVDSLQNVVCIWDGFAWKSVLTGALV